MWSWFRRRPPTVAPAPPPQGVLVRVIDLLSPRFARVIVEPGVALLDGGSEQDWPLEWVPAAARRPNGEFRVSGFAGGVPQVVAK
jgi:hypothetical protein